MGSKPKEKWLNYYVKIVQISAINDGSNIWPTTLRTSFIKISNYDGNQRKRVCSLTWL